VARDRHRHRIRSGGGLRRHLLDLVQCRLTGHADSDRRISALVGLIGGGWLIAGVVGGLVIRKPGAAIYCEMVAAVIEALLGTHYSAGVLLSGAIQGIGAELVFAALLYRRFGLPTALLSGAVSGLFMGISEVFMYYAFWEPRYQVVYVVCAVVSGLLIAGFLAWALMRALISTGVLGSVAAGRDARQMRRRA
jgi:energy-coupling factor transport system substrate-specific component